MAFRWLHEQPAAPGVSQFTRRGPPAATGQSVHSSKAAKGAWLKPRQTIEAIAPGTVRKLGYIKALVLPVTRPGAYSPDR